jgi:inner membrane protein involved in colicin E2 resistance
MARRIAAIFFIFLCTSGAWLILGATILARTDNFSTRLKDRVAATWGMPQIQAPPRACYGRSGFERVERTVDGKKTVERVEKIVDYPLPVDGSDVGVSLRLEHRQKGLLWYSTYRVDFRGKYRFTNSSTQEEDIRIRFNFPADKAVFDDFRLTIDGKAVSPGMGGNTAFVSVRMAAGQSVDYEVAYRSQGLQSWTYRLGGDVNQVRDLRLEMRTDFDSIDFPENTLSPTEKKPVPGGWQLTWQYKNLLSGFDIGMNLPEKLQPGPVAGQISFFAPVSLFFFFFLMFIITALRGIELHPMNYFFLAAAFFAFHLLLAYLVDHLSIHIAFVICSAVSIFLVVSYLRLVAGLRFAAIEAGISQFIYLVLFSYAFFFKGYTGLSVTIGAIATLFAVMQMTGRIRWAEKFGSRTQPSHSSGAY